MPRMACRLTGRPTMLECSRPAQSVQGWSSTRFGVEGGGGELGCDAADRAGIDAAARGHRLRRVGLVEIAPRHQLEDGHRLAPVLQRHLADQPRGHPGQQRARRLVRRGVPAQRLAVGSAGEQTVLRAAGVADHQPRRVGRAHEELEVDPVGAQQLMHQREREQPVRAGPDAEPLVRDRRVAGAHRVDRDDLGAARLELCEAGLDRVGIVVFGDAEHHEVFGALPVGLAELPERRADGVQSGGCHVDRAEPAVGGVVGRAELGRPPAGQSLALVAPGEKGEAARVGLADAAEPAGGDLQRLVPFDLDELGRAARAHALQRLPQPGRRQVVHQPSRALGAQHALVDRVVAIALDIADRAVLQVHLDAASARAHVTCGGLDLVGDARRGVYAVSGGHGRPVGVAPVFGLRPRPSNARSTATIWAWRRGRMESA